jgi:hypothetical protein
MDETQVSSLPVYSNGVDCVSCWELTEEEKAEVARTGRIFLLITGFSGTMPPSWVGGEEGVRAMIADNGVWAHRSTCPSCGRRLPLLHPCLEQGCPSQGEKS